jgi:cytochrome c
MSVRSLMFGTLGCLWGLSLVAYAAPWQEQDYTAEASRAQALLARAVSQYREAGQSAFAAFSRQGDYVQGDLYIYVIGTDGVMHASGGPSAALIGRPVQDQLDDDLKAAFQKAVAEPDDGKVRSAEYRWWNWQHGKVERKRVFYQRVGNELIAVGYYLPRSSANQAQALLSDLLHALDTAPAKALAAITHRDPELTRDDLYGFVVDADTGRFVAHGFQPRLVGTQLVVLKSVDGQPVGEQILQTMKNQPSGEVQYLWRNPMTGQVEAKKTFLKRTGHYIVAVGCYVSQE